MRQITKIDQYNLRRYFNRADGNLYYKEPKSDNFQILDGFDLEECYLAMINKTEFIWIEGEAI